jgi:four helix bundle protein
MVAKCVEDLQVYQKALSAADAISAILRRPTFQNDRELRGQLGESSSRVPSHISEGFEQKSDRHFAHYLYIVRGSAKETKTHLRIAKGRGHVSGDETDSLCARYDEIGKMLTGLIQHLEREDRKHRW